MPNERHYNNELNLESVGINQPFNMQAEQSVLGAARSRTLSKPISLFYAKIANKNSKAHIVYCYFPCLSMWTFDIFPLFFLEFCLSPLPSKKIFIHLKEYSIFSPTS